MRNPFTGEKKISTHTITVHRERPVRQPARGEAPTQVGSLRTRLASLREEEASLQEEVRQLRAAVQIYNQVIRLLAERAAKAGAMVAHAA